MSGLSFNFTLPTSTASSTATPSFGGSTASTSAFGSTASSATPFGSTASTPAFGSTATPTFGATASTPAFGSTTSTPSLFGAASTTPAATATTPSFTPFATTPATPAATTSSLFSSALSTPSLSTPSLGTPSLSTAPSSLSSATSSLFTPFATPIAGVSSTGTAGATGGPVTLQNVIGATKFGDLPADLQNHLEKLSKMIVDQRVAAEEVSNRSTDNISQIKENAITLIERAAALSTTAEIDEKAVVAFKADVIVDLRTVESAYNDVQRLKSQYQIHKTVTLPPKYFWDLIENFEKKMRLYSATIADIDSYLSTCNTKKPADSRSLGESIRAQYDIFVVVAERLARVHDSVEERKEAFKSFRRKYSNDNSNPFEVKKKSVLAPLPQPVTPATPPASTATAYATPTSSFNPSGTTNPGTGAALFGGGTSFFNTPTTPSLSTPATTSPLSFASPAATPSALAFGSTTPSSTLSFATPATTTPAFSLGGTAPTTTSFGNAALATSSLGLGSTSSFGSTATTSSFGSTASSASPFGSTASTAAPFGSAASPANANTKKNTLNTSQSRNSRSSKKSGKG